MVVLVAIYQYELFECGVSEGWYVMMTKVETQHTTRAHILSVRGVEGVTEPVIPSPHVVDVCRPELLRVGQVCWTGGMEDLPGTLRPTQTPPVVDIYSPVPVILHTAVRINRVNKAAIPVF